MYPLILVVDDDAELRELWTLILEARRLTVLTARDGRVGLEIAKRERPAVILLDMMMPELDGLEFLRRLQLEVSPAPPVVAMSGFHRFAELSVKYGARAFVPKPCAVAEVEALVEAILAESPTARGVGPDAAAGIRGRLAFDVASLDDPGLRQQLRWLNDWLVGYFGVETSLTALLEDGGVRLITVNADNPRYQEGCVVDPQLTFCSEVIRANAALVLTDAVAHPVFGDHDAVRLGVQFYAGAPLGKGFAFGTLCLVQTKPRPFRSEDLAILDHLASLVTMAIEKGGHGPMKPLFDGPGILAHDVFASIVDAETRRAERDHNEITLAVLEGEPSVMTALAGAKGDVVVGRLEAGLYGVLVCAADRAEGNATVDGVLALLDEQSVAGPVGLVTWRASTGLGGVTSSDLLSRATLALERARAHPSGLEREELTRDAALLKTG